ncbi:histidine kinase [Chitinophaga japonensis]|uniref:7TM protein involved in diverse intracellular signaling n=1 Tax=Chitinophaga japonensis TaxID=104662 RepID=A0A562TEL8_CHIJA|nr:histidine kinase [Chitinophaga japonensis]TWI91979.1 7TM protein involved in diverse intracellular signaling [Chitinophaga japonensis]
MNRICFLLLYVCYSTSTFAQLPAEDTLTLDLGAPPPSVDLRSYIYSLEAQEDQPLSLQQAASRRFTHDPQLFHTDKRNNGRDHDLWLKLHVRNTGLKDSSLTLFTGWHDYMYWYAAAADGTYTLLSQTGLMLDKGGVERWERYGFPVRVPAGQTRTFLLHIVNKSYDENALMPVLYNALQYERFRNEQLSTYRGEAVVIQVLLGMLLVFLSIAVINYIQLPDRSYLYFAAYILGLILFFALRLESKPYQLSVFHHWPMLKYYWDIPALLFCFYLMYVLFGNAFLNLRERYPYMEQVFSIVAASTGGIIIICFYCIARERYHLPGIIYSYVYLGTLLPLLMVFVALARRSRHHPLVRFFLFGSLCFYLACLGSFLMQIRPLGLISALGELSAPSMLMIAGVLLQAMFFLAGLSYRNKLAHLERTKTQEMLIKQLNKNKELQRKLNEQLEELVKEQTSEILRRKQELEEQRQIQLDIEYDKKLTEIELKAIRAQINPHFIFNCLNSIQLFVMQRDYEYAQKYLSDFSYLIRKTLDFSRRNFISLTDEITYLNTYLGLEKMRFENKMEYDIRVDPTINTTELEVPAMLLQPYVENAVKYGMTNPDQPIGRLTIHFRQLAGDMLECVIEDNGIGINRSKELRTLPKHHQSSGMEISSNRAELLNKMYNTGIHIEIIDKSVRNFTESGTIVRILIPQL